MQSSSIRPSATTRHKGKEIAKPVTPQSESVSEEDTKLIGLEDTDEEIDDQELGKQHYQLHGKDSGGTPRRSSLLGQAIGTVPPHRNRMQNPKDTKRYTAIESQVSLRTEDDPTGHRFLNKKTTTVPEKTMNPRSCLRWKPMGRIFSNVHLRWIPTGKLLNSCMGKVDSEPAHGSRVDIPHIHACKQTLGLSAGKSHSVVEENVDI
ncbi:hypothetical protein Tco_1490683 [Tanacetum coccineum]